MTKLISDIRIDSIVLEKMKDTNTDKIINSLVVSSNVHLPRQNVNLERVNLRMVLALSEQAAQVMDYISQRYNEYDNIDLENVTSTEYNIFLRHQTNKIGQYLNSSSPFSPVSTDLEALSLVVPRRMSHLGEGSSVAKDIIIYDVAINEIIANRKSQTALLDLIRINLPETKEDIDQLSLYAFAYDTDIPNILKDDPEDNFTINTGATTISSVSPLGRKTTFISISKENPFVGLEQDKVEENVDRDKLKVIEELPSDIAVKKYTNIADKVEELFTTFQKSKNYEINKILKKENYFSELWRTRDTKENNRFIFAFDVQAYLAKNGLFPFVYKNNELAEILISGGSDLSPRKLSSIISVEVYRQYVRTSGYLASNDLGTIGKNSVEGPNNEFPKVLVEKIEKANVNLLGLPETSRICFYEGYDNFGTSQDVNYQKNGTYQYIAECTIIDNSPEMMRRLANSMYGLKRSTKLIYDYLIGDNSITDPNTGKLLVDVKSITAPIDGENINVSEKIFETVKTYDVFIGALSPSGQAIDLEQYYQNQFETNGGRVDLQIIKDLENIIDLGIHFVYSKLEKFYPQDPFGRTDNPVVTGFANNRSRSTRVNFSTVEHTFSPTYERGKNIGFGLDYVFSSDNPNEILNSISLDGYNSRRFDEFKKYFSSGAGNSIARPVGSFEDSSYAYLTAKTIRTPGRSTIDQTTYAGGNSTAVEYDFDRYGQLFADIIDIEHKSEGVGMQYPTLTAKSNDQNTNNKIYSSARTLLQQRFGVHINEVIIPQFTAPKIVNDDIKTTIYNLRDKENCGQNSGPPLIQSVIGGEDTQNSTTKTYLDQVDLMIKNQNSERDKGDIDVKLRAEDRKDRSIKLPFVLLGELTLDSRIKNFSTKDNTLFNSLTALRQTLNITQNNVAQVIESSLISEMPNQLKSMLVFSTTNSETALSGGDGSQPFDACRPKIEDSDSGDAVGDLVSFFDDSENIPPYPQTIDPMKNYSKFLAFWMNYRQVAVVEYLDGFNSLKQTDNNTELLNNKLKLPVWNTLSSATAQDLLDQGGSILCRVRFLSSEDYIQLLAGQELSTDQITDIVEYFQPKRALNLPTYNEYFYIQSGTSEVVQEQDEESDAVNEQASAAPQSSFVTEQTSAAPQSSFVAGY